MGSTTRQKGRWGPDLTASTQKEEKVARSARTEVGKGVRRRQGHGRGAGRCMLHKAGENRGVWSRGPVWAG
jgi:hypothetical protein